MIALNCYTGADEESFRIRFDSQFSKVEEFLKAKLRESHEEVAQARQYVRNLFDNWC